MTIHFALNLYWLLLPLVAGLYWWVFAERDDEHGYFGGLGMLFRLPLAVVIFVVVLCALLGINLWVK